MNNNNNNRNNNNEQNQDDGSQLPSKDPKKETASNGETQALDTHPKVRHQEDKTNASPHTQVGAFCVSSPLTLAELEASEKVRSRTDDNDNEHKALSLASPTHQQPGAYSVDGDQQTIAQEFSNIEDSVAAKMAYNLGSSALFRSAWQETKDDANNNSKYDKKMELALSTDRVVEEEEDPVNEQQDPAQNKILNNGLELAPGVVLETDPRETDLDVADEDDKIKDSKRHDLELAKGHDDSDPKKDEDHTEDVTVTESAREIEEGRHGNETLVTAELVPEELLEDEEKPELVQAEKFRHISWYRRKWALIIAGICLAVIIVLVVVISVVLTRDDSSTSDPPPKEVIVFVDNSPTQAPTEEPEFEWMLLGNAIYGTVADQALGSQVVLDQSGMRMAVGGDGGKDRKGSVHVYDFDAETQEWIAHGEDGAVMKGEAVFAHLGVLGMELSRDGTTLAASAPFFDRVGMVRILRYNQNGTWTPRGNEIKGQLMFQAFGATLRFSQDGNILAVATSSNFISAGLIQVFRFNETANDWEQMGQSIGPDDPTDKMLGNSLDISASGNEMVVIYGGEDGTGAVRHYSWNGVSWEQTTNASGISGLDSLACNDDCTTIALALKQTENTDNTTDSALVKIYDLNEATRVWEARGDFIQVDNDNFYFFARLSPSGDRFAVGLDRNGQKGIVEAREWLPNIDGNGFSWQKIGSTLRNELADTNDGYGTAVDLQLDGMVLALSVRFANSLNDTLQNTGRIEVYQFAKVE